MRTWNIRTSMNRGELDPKLLGRIDLDAYYSGLQTAKNVLILPQGGVKRRPGTRFGGEYRDGRLENFAFNTEQEYQVLFTYDATQTPAGRVYFFINGQPIDVYHPTQFTIPYIEHPYTSVQDLTDFDFIQSADTAIITHPDYPPMTLSRLAFRFLFPPNVPVTTTVPEFELSNISFSNIPQHDFDDESSPTPTDELQLLRFIDVATSDRFRLSVDDFLSDEIVWTGDSTQNAEAIRAALQALTNTGNTGISVIPTLGTTLVYELIFSGKSAGPYGLVTASPVLTREASFRGFSTRTQTGVSQEEDSWSTARGWPISCTFHEGRLWFGGSRDRPATVWGSVVGDFFNFDFGRARDDEAIEAVLDTDQINAVTRVFSSRKLQVLTTGQHFYAPEDALTPSSRSFVSVNSQGSKTVRPALMDDVSVYPTRTGRALNQFRLVNEFQPEEAVNIATLAPHLIRDVKKMAVSRGTEDTDANYIYILNTDGTMAVFNTLRSEDVQGFSRWDTAGEIQSITVSDDVLYMLVKRTWTDGITTEDRFYLEKEDPSLTTDNAVVETNTHIVPWHFGENTVDTILDGWYRQEDVTMADIFANQENQFNYSVGEQRDTIEVGIPFETAIDTMPLTVELQNGPAISSKKRMRRAFLRVEDSIGVNVNGTDIADRVLDDNVFSPPEPFTGMREVRIRGYSRDAVVSIRQNSPYPMTILSINVELRV